MKPMKFFKSEKKHVSEKTFSNIEKKPSKFKYFNFRDFLAYYNRWYQSINWTAIEILIKINLEKALKLHSLHIFVKKWSFWDLKNFMGFVMI